MQATLPRHVPLYDERLPQPNLLQGFDMANQTWSPATTVPGGGRMARHMEHEPRDGNLWPDIDANHLGQAQLPPANPDHAK